jgi:hypothetical protein
VGTAGYIARNVLDAATSWGSYVNGGGKALPRFPPENLATYRPGRVCRFDRAAPGYVYATVAPSSASAVALVNHNLAPDAELYVGHQALPGGPFAYVRIPNPLPAGAFWFRLPDPLAGRRGFCLDVRNLGSSSSPPEFGEFVVGEVESLPPFAWDLELGEDVIDAFEESEHGVPFVRFLASRRTLSGRFQTALPDADAEAVERFKRRVQGRARPFLLIPDLDARDVLLGRLTAPGWRRRVVLPGHADGLDFSFAADPWGNTGA